MYGEEKEQLLPHTHVRVCGVLVFFGDRQKEGTGTSPHTLHTFKYSHTLSHSQSQAIGNHVNMQRIGVPSGRKPREYAENWRPKR